MKKQEAVAKALTGDFKILTKKEAWDEEGLGGVELARLYVNFPKGWGIMGGATLDWDEKTDRHYVLLTKKR